ncbi:MAG: electron transport complex subunit RsxC [Gammaproteobacteria bacterium]|nr:electron transport complex subunit RsxC [Gammaproteobacteria bacterium]
MNNTPRKLWDFQGGLHLPGHKESSNQQAITQVSLPDKLILPLQQHIGQPAEPLVKVGDKVLKGEVIAQVHGFVSAPLAASSSGTVIAIEEHPIAHPSGMSAPCIIIETDGADRWRWRRERIIDYTQLDSGELRNHIRKMGVVGLGGAGFPTFIKMNPRSGNIHTLIINGIECEPFITCDDRLMRERSDEIITGITILRHALHPEKVIIGIEDNKTEAWQAIRDELEKQNITDIELIKIPTVYPAGGERQLIYILTGKEVPSQGLPVDIGVICHNVGTVAAIARAIIESEPLLSRIITVTGSGVQQPGNIEVLIGTPIQHLIEQCGGYSSEPNRLIIGGPMMGFAINTDQVPITKTSNCILVANEKDLPQKGAITECIRCGECAVCCPAGLLPQQLYWHVNARDFDKAQDYKLFDCIECGCCAYVCPSNIPLVQYYRYAKNEIWYQEQEYQKASNARNRFEFRAARLLRDKEERAAKLRKKKAAIKKDGDSNNKKDAIQAALERVKAKKEASNIKLDNIDNLSANQQKMIDAVDQRRQQKANEQQQTDLRTR